MSYCRWSCDGFKSDVYVYESGEVWVVHIKGGETLSLSSLTALEEELTHLKDVGKHVPSHAFERISEERDG